MDQEHAFTNISADSVMAKDVVYGVGNLLGHQRICYNLKCILPILYMYDHWMMNISYIIAYSYS